MTDLPKLINATFPIKPIPKGRPRVTNKGGYPRVYTPSKTLKFEREIASMAKSICKYPLQGPIAIKAFFYFKRPKSQKGDASHIRADLDNLCKSLLDGLNGIFFKDDQSIVYLEAFKDYGECNEIRVIVEEM